MTMRIRTSVTRVLVTGALLGAGLTMTAAAAGADPGGTWGQGGQGQHGTALYVSNVTPAPHSSHSSDDAGAGGQPGCGTAAYSTIQSAVSAAPAGGTVVVCPGTYTEDVTITTPVNLVGIQATIKATGLDNGVHVLASNSRVSGFTVTDAIGEGILVQGVPGAGGAPGTPITGVTISGNDVVANDQGGSPAVPDYGGYAECAPAGGIPGDCGEGIHLMVAADVTVSHNEVHGNSGGILLTDEFGPTHGNLIVGNDVHDNAYDCGITVASHNPGGFDGAVVLPTVGGVFDNTIEGNQSVGNGILGQGGGVLLATPLPGGAVYDNTVVGNYLAGNGLAGVTVHSHAPKQDLNGNVISWNLIGTNNLDGDPDFFPSVDPSTTGVIVAAVTPLAITVSHNLIAHDIYGIWTMPAVSLTGGTSNLFIGVTTPLYVAP
jgi:parallel beta-helix repeat protein